MHKEQAHLAMVPTLEMEISIRYSNRRERTLRRGADCETVASFFEESAFGSKLVLWSSPRPGRLSRDQAMQWIEPLGTAMSSALIGHHRLILNFTIVIRPNGSGAVIVRQANTKEVMTIKDLQCTDARDIPPVFRLIWAKWERLARPLQSPSPVLDWTNVPEVKSKKRREQLLAKGERALHALKRRGYRADISLEQLPNRNLKEIVERLCLQSDELQKYPHLSWPEIERAQAAEAWENYQLDKHMVPSVRIGFVRAHKGKRGRTRKID